MEVKNNGKQPLSRITDIWMDMKSRDSHLDRPKWQISSKSSSHLCDILYRAWIGSLATLVTVACFYGIVTLSLDSTKSKLNQCGYMESDPNRSVVDIVAVVRLADSSLLANLRQMQRNLVIADIWAALPDDDVDDTPITMTFRFVRKSDVSEVKTRRRQLNSYENGREKRGLELDESPNLDDLATYDDDYPVNLDVKLDRNGGSLANGKMVNETAVTPNPQNRTIINPSDAVYAEKCKEWIVQEQQKQLFAQAGQEINSIRQKMEAVLGQARASDVELDVKNAAGMENNERVPSNRDLVQKTIYEVLIRFNGAPSRNENEFLDDMPIWKKDWK